MDLYRMQQLESTVQEFTRATERMEQLKAYVEWGRHLPVNLDDYVADLQLADQTQQNFKKEINMIVDVYAQIAINCKLFKDKIHPDTVGLCREVEYYAQGVLDNHPLLYLYLNEFDRAITQGYGSEQARERILTIVNKNVEDSKTLYDHAKTVYDLITKFEDDTSVSEAALRRKRNLLEMKKAKTEATEGELSNAIETLTRLSDSYEAEAAESNQLIAKVWVPLVDDVAKPATEDKAGKAAVRYIHDTVNGNNQKANPELINFQAENMLKNLGTISRLIGPAKTAVQYLKSFFFSMQKDFEHLRIQVKIGVRAPSETMKLEFNSRKVKWTQLLDAAQKYQAIAFISV